MRKQFSKLLVLLLGFSCLTASGLLGTRLSVPASDVFTLDSSAEERRNRVSDLQTERRRKVERLRLVGDQFLLQGDAKAALATYDEALKISFNDMVGLNKGRALMKLNRPAKAAEILKRVNDSTNSLEAWEMRVECLIKLARYTEAYAICDEIRQSFYPEYLGFLLRAKILEAQNRKEEAKKCLLDGIAHCIRYKAGKQDLVDELHLLGSEPPEVIPRCTSGNSRVLAAIKELIACDSPFNQRELYAKFGAPGHPSMISGTGRNPVTTWSGTDRKSPIEQVSNTNGTEVSLRCNLDQTYLTVEDMKQFGSIQQSVNVKTDDFMSYSLACPNGHAEFIFSVREPRQLYFVNRTFSATTLAKSPSVNFNYAEFESEIHQLIAACKYKEAQEKILQNWQNISDEDNPAVETSRRKQLRELLVTTEVMRPPVQEYLKRVCTLYLTEDVECKNRFGIDFPTAKEYEKLPWHKYASCTDPALPESYYLVYKETYPAVNVRQSSALFRQLYARTSKESPPSDKLEISPSQRMLDDAYEESGRLRTQ